MDRAHLRQGQVIRLYNGEKGRIKLSNGKRISPIVIGYVNGDDRIVPYSIVEEDTSTGNKKVRKFYQRTITADSVVDTYRTEDKSALEKQNDLEKELVQLDDDGLFKIIGKAMWHLAKGDVPAGATANAAAFRDWLRSLG